MPDGSQLAIQATIKRATLAAHKAVEQLDGAAIAELEEIYSQAAGWIRARIELHAGPDGNLALQELRSVLAQVQGELDRLSGLRDTLLQTSLQRAANLGVQPLTAAAVLSADAGMRVSTEAVEFVRNFIAEDGLQLSDRIWRLDRGARDKVINAIEQAVVQGHSAQQAARELLGRGQGVPADLQGKLNAANATALGKAATAALTKDDGNAMNNAMRVMRTEINRAHGEAYMKGGEGTQGFAGWRYLLSPAHPAPDICLRAGSLIETSKGKIPVENVRIGDRVLTHRGRFRPVTQTYVSSSGRSGLVRLRYPAENNHSRELVMTPNHPVLTPAGWLPAGDLRTGDCAIVFSPLRQSRTQPHGAGADRTDAPDSAETASGFEAKNTGSKRHDRDACGVSRKRRSLWADGLWPNLLRMSGVATVPLMRFRQSTPDYLSPSGLATATAGSLPSAETCPGVASRNSDSENPPSENTDSNSISGGGNSLKRMVYDRSDTAGLPQHAPSHSTASNRTPGPDYAPDEPVRRIADHRSGKPAQPASQRSSTVPRSSDCRIASWLSACRAPIVQGLVSAALGKIRSVFDRASQAPYLFAPKHTTIESIPASGETVFNLEVEEDHSYVANGVVVHNCDLLSSQNLYGLGPGVYPTRAKTPWPAHPNTLSFVVMVFEDEITAADRQGKETPLQALDRLTPAQRIGVLGKNKHEAFKAGTLKQGMIRAPWRSVSLRLEKAAARTALPAEKAATDKAVRFRRKT